MYGDGNFHRERQDSLCLSRKDWSLGRNRAGWAGVPICSVEFWQHQRGTPAYSMFSTARSQIQGFTGARIANGA